MDKDIQNIDFGGSVMVNCKYKSNPLFYILLIFFLVIFLFSGRLLASNYHFSEIDLKEFPAEGYMSHQVYDVDNDGLDELVIMFDSSYYVYSFENDSILFSDTAYYETAAVPSGFCGFLATDFNDNSITDMLLLKNTYGMSLTLYFQDGLKEPSQQILKRIYDLGGQIASEPSFAGNIFYGDADLDGDREIIVSRFRSYMPYIGFDIVEYSGFIASFSEPDWSTNWERKYSAEKSLFIDLNADGRMEIAAWGMYRVVWYYHGIYYVKNHKRFGIFDYFGNLILDSRPKRIQEAIGGAINPQTEGDDIIVFKDGASFNTSVFQPSGEYALYCLGMLGDSVRLLWGIDAKVYQSKLMILPSLENRFCTSTDSGGFSLHSGDNGHIIGEIYGLNNSLTTEEGHFLPLPDSVIQVIQIEGNKVRLYQLLTSTEVTEYNDDILPDEFILHQNHPNPFNPTTTIEYSLPSKSHVTVSVYNLLGRKVKILFDGEKSYGTHTVIWNGKDQQGQTAATGIYFYQIKTDDYIESKKMLLLK